MTPQTLLSSSSSVSRTCRPFSGSRTRRAVPSAPREGTNAALRTLTATARSPSSPAPAPAPAPSLPHVRLHTPTSTSTSLRAVTTPSPLTTNDLSDMLAAATSHQQATIDIDSCCDALVLHAAEPLPSSTPESSLPLSIISALEGLSLGQQQQQHGGGCLDLPPTQPPDAYLHLTAGDKERLHKAMQGHASDRHTDDDEDSEDPGRSGGNPSPSTSTSGSMPPALQPAPLPLSSAARPAPAPGQQPAAAPASTSASAPPASMADANADRIKSLVTRILKKAPPKPSAAPATSPSAPPIQLKPRLEPAAATASPATATATASKSQPLKLNEPVKKAPAAATAPTAAAAAAPALAAAVKSQPLKLNEPVKKAPAAATAPTAAAAAAPALAAAVKSQPLKLTLSGKKAAKPTGASVLVLTAQRQDKIQAVLDKHCLPKDVAAAVAGAIATKQLNSNPASVDRLLTRLFKLTPGIETKLVLAVLKQNPAVLKQSNVVLLQKWQALKSALGCTDTRLLAMLESSRNLMGLKVETIQSKLQSLADVLHLTSAQTTALVRRRPHLLSLNAESAAAKFSSLEQLLHCSHAEIVRIVLEAPEVLYSSSPEGMEGKVRELCAVLGVGPRHIGKMASSKPRLLTSSIAALKLRWLALKKVTGSCTRWSKELGSVAPSTLAGLVLASSLKVSRLEFLVAIHRPGATALTSLMNMTQAEFSSKFPGYDKWAEAQASAGAADKR